MPRLMCTPYCCSRVAIDDDAFANANPLSRVRECELQAVVPSHSPITAAYNDTPTSTTLQTQAECKNSDYHQRTFLPHPPCLDHLSLSRTTSRRTKRGERPTVCGVIVLGRCPARLICLGLSSSEHKDWSSCRCHDCRCSTCRQSTPGCL